MGILVLASGCGGGGGDETQPTTVSERAQLEALAEPPPKHASPLLKSIYRDLKSRTSVTTQVISGYDVALLGNLVIPTTKENEDDRSLPIALYMAFNHEGEIDKLTIAAVDLQPLTEAVRIAARTGAFQPP